MKLNVKMYLRLRYNTYVRNASWAGIKPPVRTAAVLFPLSIYFLCINSNTVAIQQKGYKNKKKLFEPTSVH